MNGYQPMTLSPDWYKCFFSFTSLQARLVTKELPFLLLSELSGLFHQVHQGGEHGDVTRLETHLLDLRHTTVQCFFAKHCLSHLNMSAPVKRHLPVPPGIPRPVPAEVGSCCRPWVLRLLLRWESCSHPFWLASISSGSPPSFSLSSAPPRWSHST